MARRARAGRPYDLVVLGGGTGGLVSAMIAAGVGARVALVEEDRTGGDCLWTGCVPSKALIASAGLVHAMRTADRLGLAGHDPRVDLGRIMDRVRETQDRIAPHDSPERLAAAGVEVIAGRGRFVGERVIEVAGRRLRFRRAIVATGSSAAVPPIPGLADADPLTHATVWDLRELPARLVVVGAGPIGCELGQAFARLGSAVTIVDVADRVLTREEPEASARLQAALAEDGVELRLSTAITRVRRVAGAGGAVDVELADGVVLRADRVLVAAGRVPRTADLGLQSAGVQTDEGGAVVVDPTMRTTNRRIFAVGDVTGGPAFTHLAAHHARSATVGALFGLRRRADRTPVPWVTFTDPEVAHVGLTEAQARDRWGDRVAVARSDYADLDRAVTAAAGRGGAVLVADGRGRLVGATLMGQGAGESIAEMAAWIGSGAKLERVSQVIHAYPTFAEAGARAADEHLRRRFAAPSTRRALAVVLAVRRLF